MADREFARGFHARLGGVMDAEPPARRVGTGNESARHEWVQRTLAAIPAGARLLDAGAGERQYEKFCGHLTYVAQDFGAYDGTGDERGLQSGSWNQSDYDIVSDITAIPEDDASFDAVLCTEVLEHLPDPVAAIAEFARLLRIGGEVVLTAPFSSLTHQAPYHFSTGFSRYFYEHHLPALGFEIAELEANGNYFEFLAQELRRIPAIAEAYGGTSIGRLDYVASRRLMRTLQRLTDADGGSSELLAFGFHVRGIRIS